MRPYANRICSRIQESPAIRDTLYRSDRQCGVSKSNESRIVPKATIFNDVHVRLTQVLALKILHWYRINFCAKI